MPACDRSILGTTRASRRIVEDAGTSGSRGARRAANQPRPNETSGDHPERDSGAPQPRADAAVVLHLRATYFLLAASPDPPRCVYEVNLAGSSCPGGAAPVDRKRADQRGADRF